MERTTLYQGKWLALKTIPIQGRSGEPSSWEYVERNGKGVCDGVDVIAVYKNMLICVAVYRYPVEGYVLEFPAGLLEGLEVDDCAVKELKEETGFTAGKENITFRSPVLNIDPWKSTETTVLVGISVPDIEENSNPVQELEDEEIIVVELLPMDRLLENIEELCQRKNYKLCAKVFMFAKGIKDVRAE